MRKANPMASAAWGTERIGASNRRRRRKRRLACQAATKPRVNASDTTLASRPETRVSLRLLGRPGAAKSARQGSSDGAVPPSAGR